MINEPKEFIVRCECNSEYLQVQKFKDENILYLSKFYWSCQDHKPSLIKRIKYALQVIFHFNRVNLDDVILSDDSAKRLALYILTLTQSEQKNKFIGQK